MYRVSLLLILLLCFSVEALPQAVQNADEVEVPILGKVASRCWVFPAEEIGPVVDEKSLHDLTSAESSNRSRMYYERCGFLKDLKVDFSKQSLLTYRVRGDCFIRATARLTRNDSAKTYTLWVTRIYGGCRAAGSFEGWLVVDKLLPDYQVTTVVRQRDEGEEKGGV